MTNTASLLNQSTLDCIAGEIGAQNEPQHKRARTRDSQGPEQWDRKLAADVVRAMIILPENPKHSKRASEAQLDFCGSRMCTEVSRNRNLQGPREEGFLTELYT